MNEFETFMIHSEFLICVDLGFIVTCSCYLLDLSLSVGMLKLTKFMKIKQKNFLK